MYTPEEHFVMNLADIYSLLFGYIGDGLIRAFSMQGETSVREAARRFGKDRGRTLREKHLSIGAKICIPICRAIPVSAGSFNLLRRRSGYLIRFSAPWRKFGKATA